MHQFYRAAAGVFDAEPPQDDVPDPVRVARRGRPQRRHGRGFLIPGQLSLPLRIRRGVHRGEARPAEPAQPAAHHAGAEMEESADLADALSVIERDGRVRAAHLGASTPRTRMNPPYVKSLRNAARLHPAHAHEPRQRSAPRRCQDVSGHATACVLL